MYWMADLPDAPSVLFSKRAISPPSTIWLLLFGKPSSLRVTEACCPLHENRKVPERDVVAFAGSMVNPKKSAKNPTIKLRIDMTRASFVSCYGTPDGCPVVAREEPVRGPFVSPLTERTAPPRVTNQANRMTSAEKRELRRAGIVFEVVCRLGHRSLPHTRMRRADARPCECLQL